MHTPANQERHRDSLVLVAVPGEEVHREVALGFLGIIGPRDVVKGRDGGSRRGARDPSLRQLVVPGR